MRSLFFTICILLGSVSVLSQDNQKLNIDKKPAYNIFNHLDASLTLGTTGFGVDVSSPVTNWAQLRLGYSYMPRFHYHMNFDVQVGDTWESKYDEDGNRVETRFDKLAGMLENMTGYKVQDEIEMIGRPTYHNLKFLVDVFPFQNDKRWHVTTGFFWGPSKVADAYNVTEAMPSLLAVGIYNKLYDKSEISYASVLQAENGEIPYYDIVPIMSIGGFDINSPTEIKEVYSLLHAYGRMAIHVGDRINSDGSTSPYMMEPGSDGMVKAQVRVNSFKPYLGVGYGGRILKNNDKFHIAVDLGAVFCGRPSIYTHDGTDIANDIQKNTIDGKVGDYVRLIGKFYVFPVIDLRLVYNIF